MKKTITITVKNDFHNTEITLRAKLNPANGMYWLSPDQVRNAKRRLCGISDCLCSDRLGCRGGASLEYDLCWRDGDCRVWPKGQEEV